MSEYKDLADAFVATGNALIKLAFTPGNGPAPPMTEPPPPGAGGPPQGGPPPVDPNTGQPMQGPPPGDPSQGPPPQEGAGGPGLEAHLSNLTQGLDTVAQTTEANSKELMSLSKRLQSLEGNLGSVQEAINAPLPKV